MATFGELKYAVLCKMSGFNLNEDGEEKGKVTHKGTGFAQYKDDKIATELVELSKQIESQLDDECRNTRIKAKKDKT